MGAVSLPVVPRPRHHRHRHRHRHRRRPSSSTILLDTTITNHNHNHNHNSRSQEEVNENGNESSYGNNGDHGSHPVLPRTTGDTVTAGSRFAVGKITSATGLEQITPTNSSKF